MYQECTTSKLFVIKVILIFNGSTKIRFVRNKRRLLIALKVGFLSFLVLYANREFCFQKEIVLIAEFLRMLDTELLVKCVGLFAKLLK
jgi:hypothetical protein